MHFDDERLLRLIDGEMTADEEALAREHLAQCPECRRALREAEHAEHQSRALLRALDEPTPELDLETIARLARESDPAAAETATPVRPVERDIAVLDRKRGPVPLRRVAALALAVALAGAAYAVPGSPVPRWVRGVVERVGGGPRGTPVVPAPELPDSTAGIAVRPGANLVIDFRSHQPNSEVSVSLTEEPELVIRAPSGAATFLFDGDRVVVDNRGRAASFIIQVPRGAPRVEIRIMGAPRFLKEGAQVTLAHTIGEDAYRIPLAAP